MGSASSKSILFGIQIQRMSGSDGHLDTKIDLFDRCHISMSFVSYVIMWHFMTYDAYDIEMWHRSKHLEHPRKSHDMFYFHSSNILELGTRWHPCPRTQDTLLSPPSTLAEIFRHECLKTRFPQIFPFSGQNRVNWGCRRDPPSIFFIEFLIFLLLRSPCKISKL